MLALGIESADSVGHEVRRGPAIGRGGITNAKPESLMAPPAVGPWRAITAQEFRKNEPAIPERLGFREEGLIRTAEWLL